MTVPLPESPRQLAEPSTSNQPEGQLQQSNLLESPTSRSRQDSISSSVDSRVAVFPGILSICISPRFRFIFSEISRLAGRFPQLEINLIQENNRDARPAFLQHIAEIFNVSLSARRKKLQPEDFFRALMNKERDLLTAELLEEKRREKALLGSRLEQLTAHQQQMEKEKNEREVEIRQEGEDALRLVLANAEEERLALEEEKAKLLEERNSWKERAMHFNREVIITLPPKLP